MFEESIGVWSTIFEGGKAYRLGVISASGNLRKTNAGSLELLLIGAGGTGGSMAVGQSGGGGGAGSVQIASIDLPTGVYPLRIGAAPVASLSTGGDTTGFGLTALGGGGGGTGGGNNRDGKPGGNGGGAGASGGIGGVGLQGNAGGSGFNGLVELRAGGGGGSTSEIGRNGARATGGLGGRATTVSFFGDIRAMAPGGNGGDVSVSAPPTGYDSPGAGGPAGQSYPAQSGIVAVRYELPVLTLTGGGDLPALTGAGTLQGILSLTADAALPALIGGGDLQSILLLAADAPLPALTGSGAFEWLYRARGRVATAESSGVRSAGKDGRITSTGNSGRII